MNSNLKIDINDSELLKILSAYYSEKIGSDVSVKSNISSGSTGYGMYEHSAPNVELYYTSPINIASCNATLTTKLSKDDVKQVFEELLNKLDYNVDAIDYKVGSRIVGFYRDEHSESYFNGITVKLSQKGLQKTLK